MSENESLKNEDLDNVKIQIEENKKIPKEEIDKINTRIFNNVLIAIGIMLYFMFLNLGSMNIQSEILITDLKIFGIGILAIAVFLFEYSYKKDDGVICIHGIETLILAIITLFLIPLYNMYNAKFNLIAASLSYLFAIYYVSKSIVIQNKMKKEYYKSINDISEIVKKR